MLIKIQFSNVRFELQASSDFIDTYCLIGHKMWRFSREFPKYHSCPGCDKKTLSQDKSTAFCTSCHDDFISTWEKRIV